MRDEKSYIALDDFERLPLRSWQTGWRYVFSTRKTDGRAWGRNRKTQGWRSNGMGWSDEQYPQQSKGSHK